MAEYTEREAVPGELIHSRGCPRTPGRVEETTQRAPVSGQLITVVRCLDCAAHVVLNAEGDVFRTEDSLEKEDPEFVAAARTKRG